MENFYTAYTRDINNQTFYFVKRFTAFPEYEGVPKVLNSYGMHSDFFCACNIANIDDEAIVNNLLNQLRIVPQSVRVIPLHKEKSITHSFLRNIQQALLKLRLAGID